MPFRATLCAAAIVASLSQPVWAADAASLADRDAATRHDIQCMLLGMQVAGSSDPKVALEGKVMNSFFAGAVFGNSPQIDIEAAMHREAMALATMNDKQGQIPTIGHKCATEMQERVAQINAGLATLRRNVATAPPKK